MPLKDVPGCRDVFAQHASTSPASQLNAVRRRLVRTLRVLSVIGGISLHHVCFNPALRIVESHLGTACTIWVQPSPSCACRAFVRL